MPSATDSSSIIGRDAELQAVEEFLDGIAGGVSALRLEGEAGIGKTTLWRAAVEGATERGIRVMVTRPAEAEARLAFTGLSDVLDDVEEAMFRRIPVPQRHAIDVALLRADPGPSGPDQRAIAVATLSLLRRLAGDGPVLIAVDDAQWLDQSTAQTLAFVARRLDREPVGIGVSVRTTPGQAATFDLSIARERRRDVPVGPLSLAALHRLIRAKLDLVLPRPVLVRIEAASGGNPFYALEIARELRAAGDLNASQIPVPEDLRNVLAARIRRLPSDARDALLVAAALSRPTTEFAPEEALAAAEEADVVRIEPGGRIRFTHPLLASTVYERASEERRREVHREMARRVGDPEERARHLALASDEPDDEVADALDEAASSAWARGAAHAAADLLELALPHTSDQGSTVAFRRRIRFAESLLRVGDADRAQAELEGVLGLAPTGDVRGEALLASAKLHWFGDGDAGVRLLETALQDAVDPHLRARIHARLSWLIEDLPAAAEHTAAGLALIAEEDEPSLYAYLLLQHVLQQFARGIADERATYDRAMRLYQRASPWEQSPVLHHYARMHDDFETVRALALAGLEYAREAGDVAATAHSLASLANVTIWTGDLRRGRELAEEAMSMVETSDVGAARQYVRLVLCTALIHCGDEVEARRRIAECIAEPVATNLVSRELARSLLGFLELSLGHFAAAEPELTWADEHRRRDGYVEPITRSQADLAECVLALGDVTRAEMLIEELEARASKFPRPWITCVSLRCRGLLVAAEGDLATAAGTLERALEAHGALAMPLELGRTLLAAGRVERRARRWGPARQHLDRARTLFLDMGARLWLEQAEGELRRVAARPPRDSEGLTATEQRVAALVGTGLTNRQIADALFLSPKTVETHLTRIYRKVGVRSRAALAGRLAEERPREVQT